MEQETTILQKKKQLTFEELCPLWNQFLKMESKNGFFFVDERFQTDPSNIGKLCSMKHYDKCCVGEANGWSADYANSTIDTINHTIIRHERYCSGCKSISDLFGDHYDSSIFAHSLILNTENKAIETLKDLFINHWNDKHL